MLFVEKSSGYPILEGRAVVKVSLKGAQDSHQPLFEKLSKGLKGFVMGKIVDSYYCRNYRPDEIPLIKLEDFKSHEPGSLENLEYNVFCDQLSLANRIKSAVTGLVAAGVLLVSAISIGRANGSIPDNSPIVHPIGNNINGGPEKGFPIIYNYTDKERDLIASLVPGVTPGQSNRHYFRLSGHNNMVHSNYAPYTLDVRGGEHPHHNLFEPHCDHYNHGNTAHNNHANLAHGNNENSSHDNAAHANHENLGTLDLHADAPSGSHANTHWNASDGHTNVAS